MKEQSRSLESIELVMKTGEKFSVPAEKVQLLNIDRLWSRLSDDASLQNKGVGLLETKYTDKLQIVLDTIYLQQHDIVSEFNQTCQYNVARSNSLLWRLMGLHDLSAIILHYSDNQQQYINVYWGKFDDKVNTAMRVFSLGYHGNLCLTVNSEDDVDPFYQIASLSHGNKKVKQSLIHDILDQQMGNMAAAYDELLE